MPRRCLDCPALIHKGSRCPVCARRYRQPSTLARQTKYRDKGRCVKCGRGGTPENPVEAHHIVPRALGGAQALANMVTLCKDCHKEAHRAGQ